MTIYKVCREAKLAKRPILGEVAGSSPATATNGETGGCATAQCHSFNNPIEFKKSERGCGLAEFYPCGEPQGTVLTKKMRIMENFFEILTNEDKSFEFPWWVYVIVLPLALVLILGIAGTLSPYHG